MHVSIDSQHYFIHAPPTNIVSLYRSLIHWSQVTRICVSRLAIIGSINGLSPGRRQAIIWTSAGILLIAPLIRNSHIFIQENALKNAVCEMAAILFRPQCVNILSNSEGYRSKHLREHRIESLHWSKWRGCVYDVHARSMRSETSKYEHEQKQQIAILRWHVADIFGTGVSPNSLRPRQNAAILQMTVSKAFPVGDSLYLGSFFTEICSPVFNWQYACIGSDNGVVPNGRIDASLGPNALSSYDPS